MKDKEVDCDSYNKDTVMVCLMVYVVRKNVVEEELLAIALLVQSLLVMILL